MVPTAFVVLPQLPRLGNGKLDLRSLPAPVAKRSYAAPSDAVEWVLAGLMAELLECEKVSVEDSFFDLGGHSLLVIKLVGRIRKSLQVEIPPGLVFDHASVAALAVVLRGYESAPGRLMQVAAMRKQLAQMTSEERAALQQRVPA